MAYPGARVVVLLCFLVHFVYSGDWITAQSLSVSTILFVSLVQGITMLFYPFIGILADTCFKRYGFIKISNILLILNSSVLLIVGLMFLCIARPAYFSSLHNGHAPWYIVTISALLFTTNTLSVGMFDAVGIQFGMDQMVEASSDQISAFTHWYYWSMNIGISIQAIVIMCGMLLLGSCAFQAKNNSPNFAALNAAYIIILLMRSY